MHNCRNFLLTFTIPYIMILLIRLYHESLRGGRSCACYSKRSNGR
jgi:hypothetical protein